MIFKFFIFLSLNLASFLSYGIYNSSTQKEWDASKKTDKMMLLLSQNCHSCDEVLLELETFCEGKKPSSQSLGFFVVGFNKKAIQKKIKSFKKGYDVYLGSSSEYYEAYNMQGSPSLLLKGTRKSILGKNKILQNLEKNKKDFCKS